MDQRRGRGVVDDGVELKRYIVKRLQGYKGPECAKMTPRYDSPSSSSRENVQATPAAVTTAAVTPAAVTPAAVTTKEMNARDR